LKITFFSALPPFRGGISDFSELLLQELEKKSFVKAYTFKQQYPDFLFPGKTQYSQNSKRTFPRIVSTFNPFSYFAARRVLKKSEPDIFITNYWMTFFGPLMAFLAGGFKKKTNKVAIIHNLIPHEKRFFDSFFNRIFLSRYNGFVVLSEAVKADVYSLKKNANCIMLKHPPYNQFGSRINHQESILKLGLDPKRNTLLFFGLIRDYKGLDLLLQAFSFLDESFQLVIAGEVYGSDEKYQELISTSKNGNILFVNEFIPDDEVSLYFSAADLCVLPYKSATQSGIKAIADSFHVPVLTSNVGGLAEAIVPNENGFVIENLDAMALSVQIKTIFETGNLEKVIQRLILYKSSQENHWSEFTENLLNFCQNLNSRN
jgi:glycosyltransferase involved in cell wall biosynthesis